MPVSSRITRKSSFSNPDQNAFEVSDAKAQNKPKTPDNENLVADRNNHESWNFIGPILRGIRDSTDDPGSTGADEQSDEDKIKKLNARKVKLFEGTAKGIGMLISTLVIGFGYQNINECPANLYMPYMVFAIGLLSLFIVVYTNVQTTDYTSEDLICIILGENERKVIEISFRLFAFLWFCELVTFFFMKVSFDSSADNYCNYSFHTFTIIMNIFAVLGFALGLELLYNTDELTRLLQKHLIG